VSTNDAIRYEPDERCPPLVSLVVGLQGVMLAITPLVLIVAITARAGGQDEDYLLWAVFAAMVIAGALTVVQASRLRRFGGGHILIMGVTPNFIAISVLALAEGGPALLASLIIVSSLFYLALANWLPLLRRVLTPVVSGTVLMLIAVTVLPVGLDRVQEMPQGTAAGAGPLAAVVTLVVLTLLTLRASGVWRLWSPLIGIVAGCVIAVAFGAYEVDRVADAPWAGVPGEGFPGFRFALGLEFWALLPAFVVVTLVGSVKNIGDSVAMQQASWRRPRVTDFRLVQGSLTTNGVGILLSGIAGTPPSSVYSSVSVSLANMTGVAARRVGYSIGAIFVALAFFPKLTAILLTIPSPVMGAYLLTAIGLIFVGGIRTVVQDGIDQRKALVVGLAFAIGAGLEQQTLFVDLLGDTWGPLFDNGVLAGTLVAILLNLFLELTNPEKSERLEARLDAAALPRIDEFVQGVAARLRWNDASTVRLRSAAEETLLSLAGPEDREPAEEASRLIITARPAAEAVELEFLAVSDGENLEDRLRYLSEEIEGLEARETSLRLLRHYASSVRHQQYHGLDIVTVQVKGSR
jgi:NCS2 family nucleobase:cation symporter-2/xanthine permease XanP